MYINKTQNQEENRSFRQFFCGSSRRGSRTAGGGTVPLTHRDGRQRDARRVPRGAAPALPPVVSVWCRWSGSFLHPDQSLPHDAELIQFPFQTFFIGDIADGGFPSEA